MGADKESRPSLEHLIEEEDLGLEILHPGGKKITLELAERCRIEKSTSVLDVASGTGESALYLAEALGARVTGLDISSSMVERSRRKAVERNVAAVFVKGNAHHLPFGNGVFDAVISECTMSLLDKERAIGEMVRVARPLGYVGVHDICWKENTPEEIKKRLSEIEGERPEDLKGWKTLFAKAGLLDVSVQDRSDMIPGWLKESRRRLGLLKVGKLYIRALRIWGIRGVLAIRETERIFGGKHLGYCVIAGRKPVAQKRR